MELRIGTSGWHYPGGRGTWDGLFYPLPEERPRGFDELRFYAERFNTVEINSTFYGQPRAAVSLGWVRRTPADFEFSVKLFQKFTHPATALDTSPVGSVDVDAFKDGIEPLAAAGKLGALLAQFPSRIPRHAGRARVPRLGHADIQGLPARNRAAPPLVERRGPRHPCVARRRRRRLGTNRRAEVPVFDPSTLDTESGDQALRQAPRPQCGGMVGARAVPEDRYDYMYTANELAPIIAKLRAARDQVRKLYLYMNNHFAAQAVANATMVREMLDEPVTAPMPPELIEAYPLLEGRVTVLPRARLW